MLADVFVDITERRGGIDGLVIKPPQLQQRVKRVTAVVITLTYIRVIICPIAIAYSMGQIIKSVCVCHVCICPSASTLTVTFLDRFSPKLAQT